MISDVNRPDYDVVIVGAGPAGLFAAMNLHASGLRTLVIDAGRDISERNCPLSLMLSVQALSAMFHIIAGLAAPVLILTEP